MEKTETILELRGVTKRFGTLTANRNINLTVKRGCVHAIIGENGAGKSTLMSIISGIHHMDEGQLLLHGKPVVFRSPTDASQAGIGMVYQEFMLFPELSILDNIMMGYEPRGKAGLIDRKKVRAQVEDILQTYNFNIPLDGLIRDQSVAMLQQIEIVKILYRGAELIIFDEPTSVLTPSGIEGLFRAMRFLISKGKTILFITHKLQEVLEIADEITVLKDGEIVGSTTPAQTTKEQLASMMVGREVMLKAVKLEKKTGEAVLEVRDLRAGNDEGITKLSGVDLTVHAGEIVGIAGVAGSGQVELVECLYGLRKPQGGTVRFLDRDVTNDSPRAHRCAGMGLVPQDRMADGCCRSAAIWENCIMGYHVAHGFRRPWLIYRKDAMAFTQRVVDGFSVKTSSLFEPVSSLSGGNVQKLIVGREFSQDNKLLIMEDPTRGIDIGAIEFIWKKIEELAAAGAAVLLVSQELSEVMEVSDRILVLYNGRFYDGGRHGELTETEIGLLMTGGGAAHEPAAS